MKFKTVQEYGKQTDIKTALPSPRELDFYCACCNNMAELFHKGTTYCRKCYDERNYANRLIG